MVQLIPVTRQHSKEAHEIAEAVKSLVSTSVVQLQNGFQPVEDVTAIMMQNYSKITEAVVGAGLLGEELKDAQTAFIQCFTDMGLDIWEMIQKAHAAKAAQPAPAQV